MTHIQNKRVNAFVETPWIGVGEVGSLYVVLVNGEEVGRYVQTFNNSINSFEYWTIDEVKMDAKSNTEAIAFFIKELGL